MISSTICRLASFGKLIGNLPLIHSKYKLIFSKIQRFNRLLKVKVGVSPDWAN